MSSKGSKKLQYDFTAGDEITIKIPGVPEFKGRVVLFDTEWGEYGQPWAVEYTGKLSLSELQELTLKDECAGPYNKEDMIEFLEHRDDGTQRFTIRGLLPFTESTYIFIDEKYIQSDLQDALDKIQSEIYIKKKPVGTLKKIK